MEILLHLPINLTDIYTYFNCRALLKQTKTVENSNGIQNEQQRKSSVTVKIFREWNFIFSLYWKMCSQSPIPLTSWIYQKFWNWFSLKLGRVWCYHGVLQILWFPDLGAKTPIRLSPPTAVWFLVPLHWKRLS